MTTKVERVWRFTFTLNGSTYNAEVLALTEAQALARAARQVNHRTGKSIEDLMTNKHDRLAGVSVSVGDIPTINLSTARKKYGKATVNDIIDATVKGARERFEPYSVVMGNDTEVTKVSLGQVPHFASSGYKVVGRWSTYEGGGQVV